MGTNTDRTAFAFIFVIALYGTVASLWMPQGQLQEPGPGFFPLAVSLLLLFLSGLGVLFSRPPAGGPARTEPLLGDLKAPVRIVLVTALAVAAFEPAGFLITSILFLTLLFGAVSRYPWWKALLFGVAGGLLGWLGFVRLLGVQMPRGVFGL